MFSKWQVWDVRCLECGMFRVRYVLDVGCLGYGMFQM